MLFGNEARIRAALYGGSTSAEEIRAVIQLIEETKEKLQDKLAEVVGSKNISIYDILPEFDSYLADVEVNLRMDPVVWAHYEADPRPFAIDILSDFGHFEADTPADEIQWIIHNAVTRWAEGV